MTTYGQGDSVRGRSRHGFTMVEIAIALAVIGFALVAIIGVLPTGMRVQQNNREETIIIQEGGFWIEAIKHGAEGLEELADQVDALQVADVAITDASGRDVIGLLSTPLVTNGAVVRAMSGSASEKGSSLDARAMAFRYQLRLENRPFWNYDTNRSLEMLTALSTNMHELRLELRWPVLPNGDTGNGRKVFRALVSGQLISTNSLRVSLPLYFFRD